MNKADEPDDFPQGGRLSLTLARTTDIRYVAETLIVSPTTLIESKIDVYAIKILVFVQKYWKRVFDIKFSFFNCYFIFLVGGAPQGSILGPLVFTF